MFISLKKTLIGFYSTLICKSHEIYNNMLQKNHVKNLNNVYFN